MYLGTFAAVKGAYRIQDGRLTVPTGGTRKFVDLVEHRTFSGELAAARGQPVPHVTERCVFQLTKEGMELIEIAPGVNLEREILALMEFRPVIRGEPALMDPRIFEPGPMGLADDLLALPLEQRLSYDPDNNLFFLNFEGLAVDTVEDDAAIRAAVESKLAGLGHKVYAVVNYDNFRIAPKVLDDYTGMVKEVVEAFYENVTRYTTSAFLRMKLGDALASRQVSPHMYETAEEARWNLAKR